MMMKLMKMEEMMMKMEEMMMKKEDEKKAYYMAYFKYFFKTVSLKWPFLAFFKIGVMWWDPRFSKPPA